MTRQAFDSQTSSRAQSVSTVQGPPSVPGTQVPPPQSAVQSQLPVSASQEQAEGEQPTEVSQVSPKPQPVTEQPAGEGPQELGALQRATPVAGSVMQRSPSGQSASEAHSGGSGEQSQPPQWGRSRGEEPSGQAAQSMGGQTEQAPASHCSNWAQSVSATQVAVSQAPT